MRRDWNAMSREEKGTAIAQIISLFEDDEKITKIAYDHVELPLGIVHRVLMKYQTLIDEVDDMCKTL